MSINPLKIELPFSFLKSYFFLRTSKKDKKKLLALVFEK